MFTSSVLFLASFDHFTGSTVKGNGAAFVIHTAHDSKIIKKSLFMSIKMPRLLCLSLVRLDKKRRVMLIDDKQCSLYSAQDMSDTLSTIPAFYNLESASSTC